MTFRTLALAGLSTLAFASVAQADILIHDAYARSAGAMAKAGAAFMTIENTGAEDDRLIGARADVSARVELHTHIEGDNGVMMMREVEGGFPVPAGEAHMLMRGGDHVMFLGLTTVFEQGMTIPLTLVFEKAGEVAVEVPVDLERQGGMAHGQMKMSN